MRLREFFLLVTGLFLMVEVGRAEEKYVPETDPAVLQKIEQWRDLKFGLLMHWGAYSQWGIVESWSICSEDEDWERRKNPNYEEYKRQYVALKNTFNPIRFDPDKWASAAKGAGMKYVVFTTKHHDGFCMFDTKTTDYKITSKDCPFSINTRSNVAKEVFAAFRKEGIWTGAYFSKPDWHSEDYWWPNFATPDRNVNYKISKYPERWNRFVDYTHTQIKELMSDYGHMDLLWLDGGWVNKDEHGQDIRMDDLANEARKLQPGLIVVDRAVTGMHQDYLTPENQVPDHYIADPWESCMTAGSGWAWTADRRYMSAHKAVHTLCEIVAKGGNLLLNIGPGPDGTWDPEAYQLLGEIGKWLKTNGAAIYATRAVAPYQVGKLAFTSGKDGTRYAIYLPDKDERTIPRNITLPETLVKADSRVNLMGDSTPLECKHTTDGWVVSAPETLANHPYCDYAWVLEIKN